MTPCSEFLDGGASAVLLVELTAVWQYMQPFCGMALADRKDVAARLVGSAAIFNHVCDCK